MTTPATLTHDAMFYGSDDEFLTALVPFIEQGLAQGHGITAAVTAANIALLSDALGPDASSVSFIDRDSWYQRPATTIVGWQHLLTESLRRGHQQVRLIGEVAFGGQRRHTTWTRYEAALNDLFADAPAWIVCPYDTRTLPTSVLADARRTHPAVFDPTRRASETYLPPRQFLTTVSEPMPPVSGSPQLTMILNDTPAQARRAVRQLFSASAMAGSTRFDDLLLVLTEIIANGIRHGHGRRELRVWRQATMVICEVSDEGSGPTDPLLGYRPQPVGTTAGGRGVWIAQQLCDALAIDHRDGRTRARFAIDLRSADQVHGFAPAHPSTAHKLS